MRAIRGFLAKCGGRQMVGEGLIRFVESRTHALFLDFIKIPLKAFYIRRREQRSRHVKQALLLRFSSVRNLSE
jgi:hypothetical protein